MIAKKIFFNIISIYFFQYVTGRNLEYFNIWKILMHRPVAKDRPCPNPIPTVHYRQRVGPNKMASGCILLTMKSMHKNTCFTEKRPKPFQETSGSMFSKARTKFFLGISKKKIFTISIIFKMTIQNYLF